MAWILELQKQGEQLAEARLAAEAIERRCDDDMDKQHNNINEGNGNTCQSASAMDMGAAVDELIPFYTYTDLYLRPIHKISIHVTLPKLRQMGQSVSNWEIRERLKKMLGKIELSDFKVHESSLEEVQFLATVNSDKDAESVISLLDGINFRAIGFSEPLSVKADRAKLDFPTRIDWDQFFSASKDMDEKEPGERPDTVYLSGLPFEWFQSAVEESTEKVFKGIFEEFGEVAAVDIPQCDPIRKQMEPEISGIQLSSWLFGQDPFFECYVQFREYLGFVKAITALGGKVLVRKCPSGLLREAKIKVDFDRSAHLSIRKVTQRKLRRICLEYERNTQEQRQMDEGKRLEEMIREEKEHRAKDDRERVMRALLRAERRQRMCEKRDFEHILRKRLKSQLNRKLQAVWKKRQEQAKRLLAHIAKVYRVRRHKEEEEKRRAATAQAAFAAVDVPSIQRMAEEYALEVGLPTEEELRERILRKQELKLRTRITGRMLSKEAKKLKSVAVALAPNGLRTERN